MKNLNEILKPLNHGIIYCDLDGVLVEMLGEISKIYNIPNLNDENFDIYLVKFKDDLEKNHPHFFANLSWKSDGKLLWSFILKHNPSILSSAPRRWQENATDDKKTWVKKNLQLTGDRVQIVRGSDAKKSYATTGGKKNILIDDFKKNIISWNQAGGIGILHVNAANTIAELKKLGY